MKRGRKLAMMEGTSECEGNKCEGKKEGGKTDGYKNV